MTTPVLGVLVNALQYLDTVDFVQDFSALVIYYRGQKIAKLNLFHFEINFAN